MRQSQEPQAEALQLGIDCLAFRSAEGALTPTLQMMNQSLSRHTSSAGGTPNGDNRDGSTDSSSSSSG